MPEIDPLVLAGAVGQAPWLVAAFFGYQLGRKVLADLCRTVPDVLDVARTVAGAADRISREGVRVRVQHGTDDAGPR